MSASPDRNISETTSQLSVPSSLPACRSLTVLLAATKWKWPRLNSTGPRMSWLARAIPPCAKSGKRTPISRPLCGNRNPYYRCRLGAAFHYVCRSGGPQPPVANGRCSRLVFSGVDGLHSEWADADIHCALDCPIPQTETVPRSGAAHLLVPDDHLHVRDMDSVLSKLRCINPPHR